MRTGAAPQALATLRNILLRIVEPLPGLLAAIRKTFAENRSNAIAAAQYDVP